LFHDLKYTNNKKETLVLAKPVKPGDVQSNWTEEESREWLKALSADPTSLSIFIGYGRTNGTHVRRFIEHTANHFLYKIVQKAIWEVWEVWERQKEKTGQKDDAPSAANATAVNAAAANAANAAAANAANAAAANAANAAAANAANATAAVANAANATAAANTFSKMRLSTDASSPRQRLADVVLCNSVLDDEDVGDILDKIDNKNGPGYVYVMTDDTGRYKVGSSYNPDARLCQLRTGNISLRLLTKINVVHDRIKVETYCHGKLATTSEIRRLPFFGLSELSEWFESALEEKKFIEYVQTFCDESIKQLC
jgi:hypothetical protein